MPGALEEYKKFLALQDSVSFKYTNREHFINYYNILSTLRHSLAET